MLADEDSDLAKFEPLAAGSVAPKTIFEKAENVGAGAVYRTLYWHLCRFSHPTYDTSRPDERNRLIPKADVVALLGPLDTAWQLHLVLDGRKVCEVDQRYSQLSKRILTRYGDE
jgi:hypothetical protein